MKGFGVLKSYFPISIQVAFFLASLVFKIVATSLSFHFILSVDFACGRADFGKSAESNLDLVFDSCYTFLFDPM